MKQRMIEYYMDLAERTAQLSRAQILQVGAVIVTVDDCVLVGFNGTPAGWDNECEYKDWDMARDMTGGFFPSDEYTHYEYSDSQDSDGTYPIIGRYKLRTKPEVLHAESNALMKLARSTLSGRGATLFQTHSPCMDCAKMIYQAGITSVFYRTDYKSDAGIKFLNKRNVDVWKVK